MTATFRTLLTIAAAVLGLCAPSPARAEDGAPPQRDMGPARTKPNRFLLTSGIVMLGAPYTASIVVAATSDHKADRNLYVPVAGPWMDLSSRDCPMGQTCKNDGLSKGLLIANGVFQGFGALEVVGAFLFPEVVQPARGGAQGDASQKESLRVRVAPSSFAGGYGLVASGKFF